jgi:hypothetical protein
MEIDKWIGSCKIEACPWIDGKLIHVNVRYYASGQSIAMPPVWDKTVYITDNPAGRRLIYDCTDTLVEYITQMRIPANAAKVVITAA